MSKLKPGQRPIVPASLLLLNQAAQMHQRGRLREAEDGYRRAIAQDACNAFAMQLLGAVLIQTNRHAEAVQQLDSAIALMPGYVDAHYNRGVALKELKRLEEAAASYERVLALQPNHINALHNAAITLGELKRSEASLVCSDEVLKLAPAHVGALFARAVALRDMKRFEEAAENYRRVLKLDPNSDRALSGLADCALKTCDFAARRHIAGDVRTTIETAKSPVSPFVALGYFDDRPLLRRCGETAIARQMKTKPAAATSRAVWRNDKIKIAYLSANFNRHPVAFLLAETIELHDRDRFEIVGMSFGADDQSDMRRRLETSFDQFIDARAMTDAAVAGWLRDNKVDIAVDLMGHTQDGRPLVLANRPAPIQVNYLGFPGTMGADFIDYIIADPIVAPFAHQDGYSERIVHLPDCYQPNDRQRRAAATSISRAEAGLPETGFVFASFNNSWKITEDVFGVWMRLLGDIDGSVLWLLGDNPTVEGNLRAGAKVCGVAAERIIFAPRVAMEDHLARQGLADLFLDTLPYNAHTTASDALWCGLPVLTCRGHSFAARVASSLLSAAELSELVTTSLADYAALASALARDPARLADIRERLRRDRDRLPLFDTPRYCRNLEAAYATMWSTWQAGEAPRSFAVPTT